MRKIKKQDTYMQQLFRGVTLSRIFHFLVVLQITVLSLYLADINDVLEINKQLWTVAVRLLNDHNQPSPAEVRFQRKMRESIVSLSDPVLKGDRVLNSTSFMTQLNAVIKDLEGMSLYESGVLEFDYRVPIIRVENDGGKMKKSLFSVVISWFHDTMPKMEIENHTELLIDFLVTNRYDMQFFIVTDSKTLVHQAAHLTYVNIYWASPSNKASALSQVSQHVATPCALVFYSSMRFALTLDFAELQNECQQLLTKPGYDITVFPTQVDYFTELNCYEIEIKSYELKISHGTQGYRNDHAVCNFGYGPFISKSSYLRQFAFNTGLTNEDLLFLDFYVHLYLRGNSVLSCLYCHSVLMSGDRKLTFYHSELMPFIRTLSLNRVVFGERKLEFSCEESDVVCVVRDYVKLGLGLPLCCQRKQAEMIASVLKFCKRNGIICELDSGTVLGALKTGSVMPWDIDADILYHIHNFSVVWKNLPPFVASQNMTVEFAPIGNGFILRFVNERYREITVDLYGNLYKSSSLAYGSIKTGIYKPTKVPFFGCNANSPYNPGLYVRNRYGHEVFKHTLHWVSEGQKSEKYIGGHFIPCEFPRHHACLDQYAPDGNLKFPFIEP